MGMRSSVTQVGLRQKHTTAANSSAEPRRRHRTLRLPTTPKSTQSALNHSTQAGMRGSAGGPRRLQMALVDPLHQLPPIQRDTALVRGGHVGDCPFDQVQFPALKLLAHNPDPNPRGKPAERRSSGAAQVVRGVAGGWAVGPVRPVREVSRAAALLRARCE